MRQLLAGLTVAATIVVAASPAIASPDPGNGPAVLAAPPGGAAARADINGDGIADIVMSTSARLTYAGDTLLSPNDLGGSVQVVPGGATLPSATPVLVNQNHAAVQAGMEADDKFGVALASGDFNGDGLGDVVVGNPTESVGTKAAAGMVNVMYGQRTAPYLRLIPGALDKITQDTPEMPGGVEANDLFGTSLAVGDFNADGYADLAIGSPGEAIGTVLRAGSVIVLYGSSSGLTTNNVIHIEQGVGNLSGAPENGDLFGWSLAAGDVTGDGRDDLAIVSAGEAITGVSNAWGLLHLVPGSANGINVNASTAFAVSHAATEGRYRSVVIGRFHGGAYADVVVAADSRRGAPAKSGALVVARGGAGGVSTSNLQVVDQNTSVVPDSPEENDYFGGSLAVGDLDDDGYQDLAVGTIREDGGAGQVTLLRGGTAGVLSAPGAVVSESTPAINASPQSGEGFSYGLRILDVTGDGMQELLVTAPWEDFSLQSGRLFLVDIGLSGDSFTATGSRRLGASDLGTASNYGPGVPLAGQAIVLDDNQDSPR